MKKRCIPKIAASISVILAMSLPVVPAFADPNPGTAGQLPEWAAAQKEEEEVQVFSVFDKPVKFDMREFGWITPVKQQGPWGSCWSFGGSAAAESSIISAGLVPENYRLDLSERHLAWNVFTPVSELEDPGQAGEGLYTFSTDLNAPYNVGGSPIMVSTLYASGSGPLEEGYYPYWGKNKYTVADKLDEEVDAQIQTVADARGVTFEEAIELLEQQLGFTTEEELRDYIGQIVLKNLTYSRFDDWSIPETTDDGRSTKLQSEGLILKNGNLMPDYYTEEGEVSLDAINAMKQEMMNGRAVSILFFAAQGDSPYLNSAVYDADGTYGDGVYGGVNYVQYIDQQMNVNHAVCIVGWDDSFSASNFNPEHQPPADGAWIVKNSWGSETDAAPDANGNVVNRNTYGAYDENGDTTGYFYLSYYDRTIANKANETYEFSANLASGDAIVINGYDYLPATAGYFSEKSKDFISTANVFTAYDAIDLISTSTRTASMNTRVTYAIYLLEEDAQEPDDGRLLYRRSVNLEYGGFHRIDLDKPVHFNAGQRYSVIMTAYTLDAGGSPIYEMSADQAVDEDTAKAMNTPFYSRKRVNEGESFVYITDPDTKEGRWYDWKGVSSQYEQAFFQQEKHGILIDNFSIKTYSVPSEDVPEESELPFTDVAKDSWAYEPIQYVYDRGIMTGMTPTVFGPEETLSRAQFATVLYRMSGVTGFTYKQIFPDVHEDDWFGIPAAWANEAGVINGYADGTFGPADNITREQIAVMLYRYAEKMEYDVSARADLSGYPDANRISSWAKEAMQWAVAEGLISGRAGKYLAPTGNAARAECAALAERFMKKYGK